MTFKKAKLFRFKKDQNERITCISYDDNEEYYSFLREYRSKGYRQVIITTEIMIKIIAVCRKSQAEMLGFFIDMWYNKYGDERC